LVLDEADRILDLGFEKTMNAIIENLPPERQTLLFSATQTKSVRDLARLSLKDPKYISVHQHHEYSTPAQLEQSYVVCELHQKLNMLYSFIRNHLKKKTLVFMASCKQVKYVYEAICRLRPGITVMALYGKLNQLRRVAVYNEFCKKENAVLIATDIAARGLDFPAVHWVLQLDCPEDASTYIHRAGRTARYQDDGESLLVLLPSEEKNMLHQLVERKIPIQKIRINPDKLIQIQNKLQAICAKNYEMKQSAQRCFISYLRSIYLMKNKDVFDINKLTTDEYATSLGLVISPRIRFLQRAEKLREKQMAEKISSTKTETKITPQTSSGGSEEDESENEDSNSNHGDKNKLIADKDIKISLDDSDDDILTVKTKNVFEEDSQSSEEDTEEDTVEVREETVTVSVKPEEENEKKDLKVPVKTNPKKKLSKAALAKKLARKKYKVNQKIIFDEEGEVAQQFPPVQKTFIQMDEDDDKGGINIDKTVVLMREEDKHDKQVFRQRVKDKHRAEKLKKKAGRKRRKRGDESEEEDIGVQLSINPEDECNIDLLPDPDQYFNKSEKHSHAEKEFSFSNTKKKRKKQADVKKKMLIDDMGLKEEEELALHLLMKDS
ncbi:putative ATP-dependent RNA helicase DDX10, partial [Saccoglossus kowalevskii]|uniref:ATP-dependent RNA helicase n=1 Tax=Saccoglossus kowalevskii TaxID=10224 RepID=A0ABM0MFW9_SACKO